MSMMPDTAQEVVVHLPGNAQMRLRKALVGLYEKRPEMFLDQPRYASSLWDVEAVLTQPGGDYLAELIEKALEAAAEVV